MPFSHTNKWNKKFKIKTEEYNKSRVEIEWKFVLHNESHIAIITHSQKRDPKLTSSRALYIDGSKIFSNRCINNIFTTKIDGNILKFKIEYINRKYKYSMTINNISHQIAYKQWMNANNKNNMLLKPIQNKKSSPNLTPQKHSKHLNFIAFTPLGHSVPDRSYDDSETDENAMNNVMK
eukprot:522130_1